MQRPPGTAAGLCHGFRVTVSNHESGTQADSASLSEARGVVPGRRGFRVRHGHPA